MSKEGERLERVCKMLLLLWCCWQASIHAVSLPRQPTATHGNHGNMTAKKWIPCGGTATGLRGLLFTKNDSSGDDYRVPKRDLVSTLQVLFQAGRLKVAGDLPEARTLTEELLNFKVTINAKTAHDSYESWREGIHDDLVLAVALACWHAEKHKPIMLW